MTTLKQKIARQSNWNKLRLSGALRNIKNMRYDLELLHPNRNQLHHTVAYTGALYRAEAALLTALQEHDAVTKELLARIDKPLTIPHPFVKLGIQSDE